MPEHFLGHPMSKLIAPFHLSLDDQGEPYETEGKLFDAKAYSRMKYGVRTDLKYFARLLAEKLKTSAPQLVAGKKPPAILTSYKAAAPPATTLARYCLDIINLARFRTNVPPGEMVRVYRPQDYIEEYAILPTEERKRLIGTQATNTLQGRSLEGYQPVILDDIHVTGTYTAMMRRVVKEYDDVITAYLIVCDQKLKDSAHAEGVLNTSQIHNPADLLPFIKQNDFVFTRRFLKMLLRTTPNDLKPLIAELPDTLLEQICRGVIDTDAELQYIFPATCDILFGAAKERHIF